MQRLPLDTVYLRQMLLDLLRTPSPSGRTDAAMQVIGDHLDKLGVPVRVTRRGVLVATLEGITHDVSRADGKLCAAGAEPDAR